MVESTPAYQSPLPIDLADYEYANPPVEQQFVTGDHPTKNPDGVTVSNVDYSPKTQEEKAALMYVEMVAVLEVAENEPYPSGNPMTAEGRVKYLESLHSPLELVPADQWTDTHVASLAAGGSLLQNDLEARHGAV